MKLSIVLLLVLAGFQSCASFSALKNNFDTQNGYTQSSFGFPDWVSNWFRHAKDRIYQRLFGTETPPSPPPTPPTIQFDTSELEYYARTPEKELVDLSTLSFDPELDWGFRVGKWYFVRKGTQDNSEGADRWFRTSTTKPVSRYGFTTEFTGSTADEASTNSNSTEHTVEEVPTSQKPTKVTVDEAPTDPKSTELTVAWASTDPESTVYSSTATPTQTVTQFLTQAETEFPTEIDPTSEERVVTSEKTVAENEVGNGLKGSGSAEVFMK